MNQQASHLIKSGDAAARAGLHAKASKFYEQALQSGADNFQLRLNYATSLFSSGSYRQSVHEFHQLHVEHPEDVRILNGCAVSYLRLGEYPIAIQFLKKMVSKNPQDFDSWMNLCFAAGSSGQHSDAIFYAMQALQLRPLETRAHNNLGSVLLMVGRVQDALIAFDTAMQIQPGNLDAMSNTATAYSMLGQPEKALELYQRCIDGSVGNPEFQNSLRYRMSFDLFRTGQIKTGWKMYDKGFLPKDSRSRNPKRVFDQPLWQGQALDNKTLLVWREQGLGDELMFLGTLRELTARCKHVIVECDPRLIGPLQRSFPTVMFREQAFAVPSMKSTLSDFDFQIPMGSLMGIFRNSLEDFQRSAPFITPDPDHVARFRERLQALPNRLKIGICWRSGTLSPERNQAYAPISDWEPLLRLQNVDFINLQYGDTTAEVENVARHFGVTIHQWPDIDLRDDIDKIFALIACLDHVVTATTAVSEMAPAVGTPTSILFPANSWTLFGTERYPAHDRVDTCVADHGDGIASLIPVVAGKLTRQYAL